MTTKLKQSLSVAVFALTLIASAPAPTRAQGLGGIGSGMGGIGGGIDGFIDGGGLDDTFDGAIGDVVDSGIIGGGSGIGGIIGRYRNIASLIGRIRGYGQEIAGLISDFNLERLLDLFGIDLGDIFDLIYRGSDGPWNEVPGGGSGGGAGGGDILGGVPIGELGLPAIDEADAAIDETGTSPLMEFLGTKQQEGSFPGRRYLKNLLRIGLAEEIAEATALSEEGQAKLKENTEVANDALKTSTAMMEDSEGQDVTQNIMRNVSVQAQSQQQTDTLLAIDAQLRARDDSIRNTLLAGELTEVQGARLREQRHDASAYSGVITQGAMLTIPGLFGDEGGGAGAGGGIGALPGDVDDIINEIPGLPDDIDDIIGEFPGLPDGVDVGGGGLPDLPGSGGGTPELPGSGGGLPDLPSGGSLIPGGAIGGGN